MRPGESNARLRVHAKPGTWYPSEGKGEPEAGVLKNPWLDENMGSIIFSGTRSPTGLKGEARYTYQAGDLVPPGRRRGKRSNMKFPSRSEHGTYSGWKKQIERGDLVSPGRDGEKTDRGELHRKRLINRQISGIQNMLKRGH